MRERGLSAAFLPLIPTLCAGKLSVHSEVLWAPPKGVGEPRGTVTTQGTIVEVCVSARKGTPKTPVGRGRLVAGSGVEGDAHAGATTRQVSLLCQSSADKLRDSSIEVTPGMFAENLTVSGLDAGDFPLGARIRLQRGPVLQVSQIGKECHSGCAIARQVGRCVMPTEGIFARVIRGGEVRAGDSLEVFADEDQGCTAGGQ